MQHWKLCWGLRLKSSNHCGSTLVANHDIQGLLPLFRNLLRDGAAMTTQAEPLLIVVLLSAARPKNKDQQSPLLLEHSLVVGRVVVMEIGDVSREISRRREVVHMEEGIRWRHRRHFLQCRPQDDRQHSALQAVEEFLCCVPGTKGNEGAYQRRGRRAPVLGYNLEQPKAPPPDHIGNDARSEAN